MTIEISHTSDAGTLIDGLTRSDGVVDELRANGWRFNDLLGAWYVPHSRGRAPKLEIISRTADRLRARGYTVEVAVGGTYATASALTEAVRAARALEHLKHYQPRPRRPQSAREARDTPTAVANRIEMLRREQSGIIRRLDGKLPGGRLEVTALAAGEDADQLRRDLDVVTERLGYWSAVRDGQIAGGQVVDFSPATVAVADEIHHFGRRREVLRVEADGVIVRDDFGHDVAVPYTQIREHRSTVRASS